MNTLLNPKRISIINSQSNIAHYESKEIYPMITNYIDMCRKDVNIIDGKPAKQHLVPKFLLENFEGNTGDYSNRLRVVSYKIYPDGKTSMNQVHDVTSKGFSKQKDFYTIDEFYDEFESSRLFGVNDKYRIEKLLSVIERNTAPILKMRQQKSAYSSAAFSNPYLYPTGTIVGRSPYSSSSLVSTVTDQRVALSVFFAVQYLRSYSMSQLFIHNMSGIQKMDHKHLGEFTSSSFPDFIDYLLPKVSATFYGRAWRWVYSDYDGLMPGGTAILPLLSKNTKTDSIAGEDALIMPLGRNSAIYFLKEMSFLYGHDGVFKSQSLALSVLSNSIMAESLARDTIKADQNEKIELAEARVCMHPETNLAHIFKTGQKPDPRLSNEVKLLLDAKTAQQKVVSFLGTIPRKRK